MVKYRYNCEHEVCAYNVIAIFYIWCLKTLNVKVTHSNPFFLPQVTFGYFCRSALWIIACQGAAQVLVGIFSMPCHTLHESRERHKGMFLLCVALWVTSSTFQTPGHVCQNCWELWHKAQKVKIKRKKSCCSTVSLVNWGAGLAGFVLYRVIELNRSCRVKGSREFEKPMKTEPRIAGEL